MTQEFSHGPGAGRPGGRRPGGWATRGPISSAAGRCIRVIVGKPVDLSARRAGVRAGRPLDGEPLREVMGLMMSRVREQPAGLPGEPAPATRHQGAGRDRPRVPGSAA